MTGRDHVAATALRAAVRDHLADWVELGVLDLADVEIAATLAGLAEERRPEVHLAVALAARAPRQGHVGLDPARVAESIASEREHRRGADAAADIEVERLVWPTDPAAWLQAVETSALARERLLVVDHGLIYLGRFHRGEVRVADQIRRRASAPGAVTGPARVEDLAAALTLNPRQREAVDCALDGSLSVIVGGPGTGKTTTVAALLAALVAAQGPGLRIALAAPTGKAATRMGESVSAAVERLRSSEIPGLDALGEVIATAEPSTLHRLLGLRPDRDRATYDATNPLPHDVIIVDETSMVSLPLMDALLDAARPEARLVLVGDPDQLASVDAGSVLADLVAAAETGPLVGRVVRLTVSHRFPEGSPIDRFATAVREGDVEAALEVIARPDPDASGVTLDWSGDPALAEARLGDHARTLAEIAARGDVDAALDALEGTKVLCAHRRGRSGVSWWNARAEAALAATGVRLSGFYPGRPVLVTANDPLRHLFNGDLGVAVSASGGPRVAFAETSGARLVPPAHLGSVETVHAMTIHKSQGSEFDHVVVVLPPAGSRLATRELLYTAVTRARRRVTLVGDLDAIRVALAHRVRRASGLAIRLGG